jgi:site-specific recombinase XerD
MDLSKVGERSKLDARREPHWQRLAPGRFLGYRPASDGAPGSWIARLYDASTRRQQYNALGVYSELAASERFTAAKEAAETWFRHIAGGGERRDPTVAEAAKAYALGRPEAAARFRRTLYDDELAKVRLSQLGAKHLKAWRARLSSAYSASTVNREIVPLRAALNMAFKEGVAISPATWADALRPTRGADRRRTLYLDRKQRRKLIDAAAEDAGPFFEALCLVPLRPGAMAALKVGSFEPRTRTLSIGADKGGAPRQLVLPKDTATLFSRQADGQEAGAWLFRRSDGGQWQRDAWDYFIKRAAIAAGLPGETVAYTLRHSTITDLIAGGLDALTVARLSGTSLEMIDRHYGHLLARTAERGLARLKL